MSRYHDLTGQRFGRLIVVNYVGQGKGYQSKWLTRCDCGVECIVFAANLNRGNTKSCGCLQKERALEAKTIHGLYFGNNGKRTKLSRVWGMMKDRCNNPNNKSYTDYGGRGIKVCLEWQDYIAFYGWAIKSGYQEGLSIERKNNNMGYSPDNCSWATQHTQSKNKRNNVRLTFNGETKLLSEWASDLGIDHQLIGSRIKKRMAY